MELETTKQSLFDLRRGSYLTMQARWSKSWRGSSGFNGTFEFEEKKKGDYINSSKSARDLGSK